jgi:hypothetical protein
VIKQSPTILLPRWKDILDELAAAATMTGRIPLSVCIMPCDVPTRWDTTYKMLIFAYQYREAIDRITSEHGLKLRDYGLSESEWETVKQLQESLSAHGAN